MDIFDFSFIEPVPVMMLDPDYRGEGSGRPDFWDNWFPPEPPQVDLNDYADWQIDAARELGDRILNDPKLAALLEAYKQIPNPPEHVENMVVNQTALVVADNLDKGSYDDILDQYAEMSGHAAAWESANGFDDPFLDWNTWNSDSFWRDDGPSWWGDEYGLY